MLFFKAATLLDLKLLNGTKSGQRVAAWTGTAERLNQPNIGFKVNQRSVRENFDKMMREFNSKEREENRASGIEADYSEVHRALKRTDS